METDKNKLCTNIMVCITWLRWLKISTQSSCHVYNTAERFEQCYIMMNEVIFNDHTYLTKRIHHVVEFPSSEVIIVSIIIPSLKVILVLEREVSDKETLTD